MSLAKKEFWYTESGWTLPCGDPIGLDWTQSYPGRKKQHCELCRLFQEDNGCFNRKAKPRVSRRYLLSMQARHGHGVGIRTPSIIQIQKKPLQEFRHARLFFQDFFDIVLVDKIHQSSSTFIIIYHLRTGNGQGYTKPRAEIHRDDCGDAVYGAFRRMQRSHRFYSIIIVAPRDAAVRGHCRIIPVRTRPRRKEGRKRRVSPRFLWARESPGGEPVRGFITPAFCPLVRPTTRHYHETRHYLRCDCRPLRRAQPIRHRASLLALAPQRRRETQSLLIRGRRLPRALARPRRATKDNARLRRLRQLAHLRPGRGGAVANHPPARLRLRAPGHLQPAALHGHVPPDALPGEDAHLPGQPVRPGSAVRAPAALHELYPPAVLVPRGRHAGADPCVARGAGAGR